MASPVVSVIVTVYKRAEFLAIALRSALDQTYQDYEIIVTDDSSSEALRAICESFGSDRIRYRTNGRNVGVALNVRAAVAEARGTYIAMLNDDDAWEPTFLEKLVAPLQADSRRVLAFSDHWIVDGQGVVKKADTDANTAAFGRAGLPDGEVADLAELVLVKNGVPLAMAAVFRADAIDWNDVVPEVSGAYDYWISCLLAASGGKAWYVAQRLTRYRVHDGMETARRAPDKAEHLVYIHQTLMQRQVFPRHAALLKQRYADALYLVGKDNLMFDRTPEARNYLSRSMKIAFGKKTLAFLCLSYLPSSLRSAAMSRRQP
jgi:glycosyltransferase involved in cell wall biosynthesis